MALLIIVLFIVSIVPVGVFGEGEDCLESQKVDGKCPENVEDSTDAAEKETPKQEETQSSQTDYTQVVNSGFSKEGFNQS